MASSTWEPTPLSPAAACLPFKSQPQSEESWVSRVPAVGLLKQAQRTARGTSQDSGQSSRFLPSPSLGEQAATEGSHEVRHAVLSPQAPPVPRTSPYWRPSPGRQPCAHGLLPLPKAVPVFPESRGMAGVGSQQPRSRGNQACRRTPGTEEPGVFPAPPAQLTWPLPPSQALGADASPALQLPDWTGGTGTRQSPGLCPVPLPGPPPVSAETRWRSEAGVCMAHREAGSEATHTHPQLGGSRRALCGVPASRGPCD